MALQAEIDLFYDLAEAEGMTLKLLSMLQSPTRVQQAHTAVHILGVSNSKHAHFTLRR